MWSPPEVPPQHLSAIMEQVEASPHPRLFATAGEFESLRAKAAGEGIHGRMLARIVFLADGILPVPPAKREKIGRRLLSVSRLEVYRISTLALAYRMTGKAAYLDRCVEELRAIASFEDWNPSHFLDVGEMTLAVSTGYDWLYDELSPEDRDLIAGAILEKGLRSSDAKAWWRSARNNWGQVCRTGMMAGALAVAERAPETCLAQMAESLRSIALPMENYAPGGNYPEGPGYWNYGTGYNVLGLSVLESACGTDFGLSDAPGFRQTGFYNDLLYGPSGLAFNYADCGGGMGRKAKSASTYGIPWWFARRYRDPAYVAHRERPLMEQWCAERGNPDPAANNGWFRAYSFFWVFDEGELPAAEREAPLLWNPQGPVPIAVARTSWDDPDAVFLGVKGGSPSASHGHMDCGSFVLDAFGERWIADLGPEEYNRVEQMGVGLWNGKQDGERWALFRLNNFSHNTLTVDGRLQRVAGKAEIVSAERTDGRSTIVLDLTSAYSDVCTKAVRTVTLDPDGAVVVSDHLEGVREGAPVSWRVCTLQKVREAGDGRVVLDGGRATMEIRDETDAGTWAAVDVSQPEPFFRGDSPNAGVTQLRLDAVAPADGTVDLRVRMKAAAR